MAATLGRMIRNIIFDWSGTLVDDLPAVWQATNYVLTQAGAAGDDPGSSSARSSASPSRSFTTGTRRTCRCRNWRSGFTAASARCRIRSARCRTRASSFEFCRARKLRTFLLSTVHRDHFAVQSAVTGFGQYLDRPYLNVWDKRKKIHEILEENQLAPDETLFIGDMQHDIETARHGGIHSCAVLTGYNTLDQLRAAEPDLIVEHLRELRDILEQNELHLKPPAKRFEESHPPIVTVGGLIFNGAGEVLMIRTHKWSNLWGIPGGKIKWGETSVDALRARDRGGDEPGASRTSSSCWCRIASTRKNFIATRTSFCSTTRAGAPASRR